MKKYVKIIDGDRVTIVAEPDKFQDDLPDEIDFSKLERVPNPLQSMIILDSDVAQYFKTAKQVNDYLRKQIKLIKSAVI
jgi:hypothetical protein